jgi:hypothetical protein
VALLAPLFPATSILGAIVASMMVGAAAGAVAGAVNGAFNGGLNGALQGAGFGFVSGALAPLAAFGIGNAGTFVLGALLSYKTDGWRGLVTFGASFLGSMAGKGLVGAAKNGSISSSGDSELNGIGGDVEPGEKDIGGLIGDLEREAYETLAGSKLGNGVGIKGKIKLAGLKIEVGGWDINGNELNADGSWASYHDEFYGISIDFSKGAISFDIGFDGNSFVFDPGLNLGNLSIGNLKQIGLGAVIPNLMCGGCHAVQIEGNINLDNKLEFGK